MLVASAALYALELIKGPSAFQPGISHPGDEDARSLGSVRLRLPSGRRSWVDHQHDLTLALRVDTKLGKL